MGGLFLRPRSRASCSTASCAAWKAAPSSDPAQTLSPREREIVQLLAEGKSNKEVARALGITVKTAETHRSNIMRKMEFASLSDLIRYAIQEQHRRHLYDAPCTYRGFPPSAFGNTTN